LHTGSITAQYHVVYDDFFETVTADATATPTVWEDLVIFSRYQSDLDDPTYVPELDKEWLTPAELEERQEQRRQSYR
jgi:hypothetical protein